jgi:hypothetical protein
MCVTDSQILTNQVKATLNKCEQVRASLNQFEQVWASFNAQVLMHQFEQVWMHKFECTSLNAQAWASF